MSSYPMKAPDTRLPSLWQRMMRRAWLAVAGFGVIVSGSATPPNPNLSAARDAQEVLHRGDVVNLPQPLKDSLARMARRPHSYLPLPAFAEADKPSQLFQYYLLNTRGFQPNVFTAPTPEINDHAIPTAANAANGQQSTIG